MATKKTAAVLKAEKADKAAKAKAAKEKKEAAAAAKAAKAASDMLEKAKKEEVSYSPIVTKAYSKKWSKEELVSWVKENYDGVECIEMNNKQIAFSINGNRVPTEGFLTVY